MRTKLRDFFSGTRPPDALAIATLLLLLAIAFLQSIPAAPVLRMQHALFDGYQVAMPRERKSSPVTIVVVDEESLKSLGQWPWPRSLMARLLERMIEYGPAAIGTNAFFSEPDRYSPDLIAEQFGDSMPPQLRSQLRELPSGDRQFAKAIRSGPVVLGVIATDPLEASVHDSLNRYGGQLQSVGELHEAASGWGLLNAGPSFNDGIVRVVPVVARVRDAIAFGLSSSTLQVAARASPVLGPEAGGNRLLTIGASSMRIQADGTAWVHFRRFDPRIYVSAAAVLDGSVQPALLKDRIVLFGLSGLGLLDYKLTPLGELVPGPDVQAQVIEQMLDGRSLSRFAWMRFVEAGATVVFGVGAILLARYATLRLALIALVCALGLAISLGTAAFDRGTLVDVATPGLAWVVAFSGAIASSLVTARRAREKAVYMFSRFVNPHVVRELLKDESLAQGGRERQITLLFSDIRNFTHLSERQTPSAIVGMLNAYFSRQVEIVFRHKGSLDKFIGDAMMVFWGAPLDDPAHAQNAVRCALELAEEALRFRESVGGAGIDFDIGIGLHTGSAVVGLIGSEQRREYTAIGPVVNVANRVEGLTKEAKRRVLVTRETMEACGECEFVFDPAGWFQVKGVDRDIEVFSPRKA